MDEDGLVLAVQRGKTGSLPGSWEFPGGKVEPGEDREAALRRELREELHLVLDHDPLNPLLPSSHLYPFGAIRLWPFLCRLKRRPNLTLLEHSAQTWLPLSEARLLDWAPADVPILDELERVLSPS